uniref:TNase-like domain-containing protein n=1 Tax=Strongyloides stercoralis TaxID=6248 RepID=A0A0K0ETL7_STRER
MGQNSEDIVLEVPPLQNIHEKSLIDAYPSLIVRGGIIFTGLLSLGVYLKTSPSFRRFKHVNQIPKIFFDKEIVMKGIVKNISSTGKFNIEHLPLIKVPLINTSKGIKPINVNLAGVELSDDGINMITKNMKITNKIVNFKVIKPTLNDKNCVDGEIIVKTSPFTEVNLSQYLVRKGFAKIFKPTNEDHVKTIENNKVYANLIKNLLISEEIADKRGIGVWEKQSWVEDVQTISGNTVNYLKNSPLIKLSSSTGTILKNASYVIFVTLSTTYHTILATISYTKDGYVKLANIITKIANSYNKSTIRKNVK